MSCDSWYYNILYSRSICVFICFENQLKELQISMTIKKNKKKIKKEDMCYIETRFWFNNSHIVWDDGTARAFRYKFM